MAKYSGDCSARYHDPTNARGRIYKIDLVWTVMMNVSGQYFKFIDDGKVDESKRSLFIVIRSSYLPLRRGREFIVEPYSPHRFGRQFGYFQEVPEVLKPDVQTVTSEEAMTYWLMCILSKSNSKAMFLSIPSNVRKLFSNDYKEWWTVTHGTYFEDYISFLSDPKSISAKGKKHFQVNTDDRPHPRLPLLVIKCDAPVAGAPDVDKSGSNSRQSKESDSTVDRYWERQKKDSEPIKLMDFDGSNNLPSLDFVKKLEESPGLHDDSDESQSESNLPGVIPLVFKKRQKKISNPISVMEKPASPEVSIFFGEKCVTKVEFNHIHFLWDTIRDRIAKTKLNDISSLKAEIQYIYERIKIFKDIDVSHLDGLLQSLFSKAAAYDDARSSSSKSLSKELLEARLRLVEAQTK